MNASGGFGSTANPHQCSEGSDVGIPAPGLVGVGFERDRVDVREQVGA